MENITVFHWVWIENIYVKEAYTQLMPLMELSAITFLLSISFSN